MEKTQFSPQVGSICKVYKKKTNVKELLCIWSILIIPLINLCIFWVYGTIQSYPIAFEQHGIDGTVTYGLDNFKYIIDSFKTPGSIFPEALLNNLKYWAFGFMIMMPTSYIMAYFLYKKIWGHKFFRYVFFFPSIVSSVIIASLFKYLVEPGGQIHMLLAKIFGTQDILLLADSRFAFGTMLFYNFYTGLAGNLIYYLAAFARIPQDVIEAGRMDGVSGVTEITRIVFPLTLPFFATIMLLQITGLLATNGAALLLTGGAYGTYDLGFYEYELTISGNKMSEAIAGAIGILKGLVVLPIAFTVNALVNKIDPIEY